MSSSNNDLPSWASGYRGSASYAADVTNADGAEADRPAQVARQTSTPAPQPPAARRGGAGLIINDPNARVEGRFEIGGTMEVECDLTGEISASNVTIGEAGNVHAVIHAQDVVIRGRFEGQIVAGGSIEITGTGRATGTLRTESLIIARGAVFNGDVERMPAATVPEPATYSAPAAYGSSDSTEARNASSYDDAEPASDDDDSATQDEDEWTETAEDQALYSAAPMEYTEEETAYTASPPEPARLDTIPLIPVDLATYGKKRGGRSAQ